MKPLRESTNTLVTAGGVVFLIVVSVYDRDPTIFTWLLVLLFVVILVVGLRERTKSE